MAQIAELIPFNTACDEFISGKYILADIKISSILRIIAEDEKLKDIVSSCLESYDFNTIFKHSIHTKGNAYELNVPTNEKELIAFVFSLLYKLDNKDINFYDFISQFYKNDSDEPGKEFYNFANAIIIPFKNAVNSLYSKRHVIVEADDYQKNYYNKLMNTTRLIAKNIDSYKLKMTEKEEFTMLLNSLYLASEHNDKKMVYSLMIALDYFSRINKRTKSAYLSLEECFT